MNQDDNLVHLKIFGEEYTVKSKADEDYLQTVASYVDRHMREISENLPASQPMLRIAILAAMNISDEVFEMREQLDKLEQAHESKAKELTSKIDEVLTKYTEQQTA
ncbi:MAG: cell division protein ZapA [Candidatus Marinimicrobia bacterium]|nr:cell division protein ZapA [Candidatus Neomarinimicrobiota bacterium]MCF7828275.1 cell division protein ZapA [Candidatus Neomarinimicrobiota bacterium]MCF7879550.1 cell division protein ZapA [Candidatus Neomarinimicrobiota bacterium]